MSMYRQREKIMKFTAVGDALIQQRVPKNYEGFEGVRDYIMKGDARFFNLETTVHEVGECYASQFSGGTYMRTSVENYKSVLDYGFNMTSFNNNHTMDFSYGGLMKTLEAVEASNIVNSGVGRNMADAAAPHYLDTPNGRVALISANSSFDPSMMAGEASRRFPGRPGINGLRFNQTIYVTKEDMARLEEISDATGINETRKLHLAQGYATKGDDDIFVMGNLNFKVGDKAGLVTTPNKEDVARVVKAIYEAQLQADYIIVSLHTHQLKGASNEAVPDFVSDFAHACIDAGAHAVIGHGPHLLRPIEVYNNRPIFYSLGDFLMQLYSVEAAPEDFFKKQSFTSDATVHDLIKKRSNNFNRGLMEEAVMAETVIPYWEMEDGVMTKLELLPVTCYKNDKNHSLSGLPVVNFDAGIAERLAKLSEPYGVKMTVENGIIKCEW